MKHKILLLPLAFLFLLGCQTSTTGKASAISLKDMGEPIQICFTPYENCDSALVHYINTAQRTVHCAFFDLTIKQVIDMLKEKSKQLDVKLVIDSDNYDSNLAGLNVVYDDERQFSHNKFCVLDSNRIVSGSFNPTVSQQEKDNNNLLMINSRLLAINYEDEFSELWAKEFGEGNKVKYPIIKFNDIVIENYFCPEDSCAERIIGQIRNAKSSIYFMLFAFTGVDIADAILFSKAPDIRGKMDKMQASQKYSQYKRLREFGIDVRMENSSGLLHHKVFIIDNETVITGSFNPTEAANTKNDENILIIHDKEIAEKYAEEFSKLST